MKFWVLVMLLLPTSLFAQAAADNGMTHRLDELYDTFFTKDGVGGAALVSKGGQIIYEKYRGMADLEHGSPISSNSVLRIGSITKQFTAVAILQLLEQEKLALSDNVQKHLTNLPKHLHKITLENLLTHTSGLKNLTELRGLEIKQSAYTPQQLIDLFKDLPLDFEPGERFHYSNSGYILLGAVIEKVSGQPYADYMQSEIFNKLGMKQSFYDDSTRIVPGRARGYDLNSQYKLVNSALLNMSFPYAAGGLMMTARDYFEWHNALSGNRVIRKETLEKAFKPFQLNDKTFTQYGFGWRLGELFGGKTVEHGGRINGFNAKATYLPEGDVLVVTFSNGGFINTDMINDQAAAIAADYPQFREIRISEALRKRYTGTYKFPNDDATTIRIYSDQGGLFLKDSNAPNAWKMRFTAENEFGCYEVFPNTHLFSNNSQGEVEAMIIRNPGGDFKVVKVK